MVRAAAIAICLATTAMAEPTIKAPPTDWLAANTPHGFDVTLDGNVWMNVDEVGAVDDYAILATDLYGSRGGIWRKLWVRGYHARNPEVKYRESKHLIQLHCQNNTITVLRQIFYSLDGKIMWERRLQPQDYIIPGSHGEAVRDFACRL